MGVGDDEVKVTFLHPPVAPVLDGRGGSPDRVQLCPCCDVMFCVERRGGSFDGE
jgi:hypothetical protein